MGGSLSRACQGCLLDDPNQQQFARFRVKHHVRYGQGSFGATFLAYDLEADGQRVAAKRVNLAGSSRETLQREVDIVMALHHENIVTALGACTFGDSFWIFISFW